MKKIYLIHFLLILSITPAVAVDRPNVLFIIADDLNCDIGAYGHYYVKTPNIDRLAQDGLLFENAFCNFPLCGPSRASFMTGLYPDQNNLHRNAVLIRDRVPDVVTMSQHFINNGYTAARVGKIYHYHNPRDIGTDGHDDPASWTERYNPRGRDKDEEDKIFSLVPGKFGGTLSWLAAGGEDEEQTDGMVATRAIKLMKKYRDSETPFFLAVGFFRPHTPYVAPKKYYDMYDKDRIRIPEVPEGYYETLPEPAKNTVRGKRIQNDLPAETVREVLQAYYATITFMDAQLGRVLDAVEELGLKDNTIILFTSDHGYHMGEHGHYQKQTLFENADRVPLIVSLPGRKGVLKRTNSIIEMVDFYRTLSDMAGLPDPGDKVSGVSFAPLFQNAKKKVRDNALTQSGAGYTLRTEKFRYTRWGEGGPDMIELYDRKKDPQEMHNLAGSPEFRKLIAKLDAALSERVAGASKRPEGLTVLKKPAKLRKKK